ncbi:MAG TPA: menaquinone biosynthesis protein [Candidatus Omnitrophota bacterium]|nr:menaquinone biosynthesis protein [Candidatus Omnitrophota bacterium]
MSRRLMRLGSIEFINSLPVDQGLLKGLVPFRGTIVPGTPASLNEIILSGGLEVSPVSVFWYARHQREFLLLPELSISSESGVMSVLLFSRRPLQDLAGERIAVTSKGRTTPALLEILCRQRYGFSPQFEVVQNGLHQLGKAQAVLLIGDEALQAQRLDSKEGYFVTDLAEEWRAWTGLPVVFAVWAARRAYFEGHADEIQEAHAAILESKRWGLTHLDAVIEEAQNRTGLPTSTLKAYFSRLSYDLDAQLQKGLSLYLEKAVECGLLEEIGPFEFISHKGAYVDTVHSR